MATELKIDFVSDIACPWCVVGLRNMEAALANIGNDLDVGIRFGPFELAPDMPQEGVNRAEAFAKKYRMSSEEAKARGDEIVARAAETGFAMNTDKDFRVYNTFDCHRLLTWAGTEGKQRALKHALFEAYFSHGKAMNDDETLAGIAASVGLDADRAREILAGEEFAESVRAEEQQNRQRGIQSVPTIIVNGEYVINGGQPPEIFEKAFRHIAGEVEKAEATMPEAV